MADTGFRDSGRIRDDFTKLWNDMYYGNGKPGITTRVQLTEDAVDRIEGTLAVMNASLSTLNQALHKFQGGSSALNVASKVFWALLGGLGATVAFLISMGHY